MRERFENENMKKSDIQQAAGPVAGGERSGLESRKWRGGSCPKGQGNRIARSGARSAYREAVKRGSRTQCVGVGGGPKGWCKESTVL